MASERSRTEGTALSDSPPEGGATDAISPDDPHKAEKLTAPSVDGDVGEAEE